jgi:SSS family solute:Na+ symporter
MGLHWLDWSVLFGTLLFIVLFGIYKTRGSRNIDSFLRGDNRMHWWTIGLSIMATQASAITFLSTPGQAYEDGMRFIQFYFGLPLAMVVLSVTFIPIFYRLKVYTAYEYLEMRFDQKTRTLGALLFLIQRGLAAGITIYAPAIILSTVLGWDLKITNLLIGGLVILYTISGGTRAVSQTQKQQMAVMMGGMITALVILFYQLPEQVGFGEAVSLAGAMGKLNLVDLTIDFNERYNLWSGLLGGFFLAMAYFGTDQSQVQRYLSGRSLAQSRIGLLMNGLVKIPMQFLILFIGAMVFVFYQFQPAPMYFKDNLVQQVKSSEYAQDYQALETRYEALAAQKREAAFLYVQNESEENREQLQQFHASEEAIRKDARTLIGKAVPEAELKDTDYVFITFVLNKLPIGIIGLLLAVIFSAAMSSTAGELNALASTTTIDLYKRNLKEEASDAHYLSASRWFTLLWGVLAIAFATYASLFENLIEAVNILGSLFYGVILGIFLVAFYLKRIGGNAVFVAALVGEAVVLYCYFFTELTYLWFNLLGCGVVVLLSLLLQPVLGKPAK